MERLDRLRKPMHPSASVEQRLADIGTDIVHKAGIKAAKEAEELERERRIIDDKVCFNYCEFILTNGYRADSFTLTSSKHHDVMEQLQRQATHDAVIRADERERAERITEDKVRGRHRERIVIELQHIRIRHLCSIPKC
jgi:hypothetical protein